MTRKKGKPVSFDAMVKFFMHNYNIPTKRDIDNLNKRLDRLEKLIRQVDAAGIRRGKRRDLSQTGRKRASETFTDKVLEEIVAADRGIGVAEIQSRTGFDSKKIRNIIFRLSKDNKIKRVSRGVYTAV